MSKIPDDNPNVGISGAASRPAEIDETRESQLLRIIKRDLANLAEMQQRCVRKAEALRRAVDQLSEAERDLLGCTRTPPGASTGCLPGLVARRDEIDVNGLERVEDPVDPVEARNLEYAVRGFLVGLPQPARGQAERHMAEVRTAFEVQSRPFEVLCWKVKDDKVVPFIALDCRYTGGRA